MGRYEKCAYFDALYEATIQCFSGIDAQTARTILREAILAPNDYTVEFNAQEYNKPQLMTSIADTITQSCFEQTPQQTHYLFVEQAAEIIKHMNDGYITDEDYAERQLFLQTAEKCEFLLFTAYCLFMTANYSEQSRLNEILLNIIRLRELNDLINNYTRNEQGVTTDREEFERAKPIYKMLKSLQTLGYDYNFSPKERESLNIDHEDDTDLSDSFNHENWLKRIMLLRLRQETADLPEIASGFVPPQNEPLPAYADDVNAKIAQLRGTFNKRSFDKNRFLVLEKSKAPLAIDADSMEDIN